MNNLLSGLAEYVEEEKTAGILESLFSRRSKQSYEQLARRQRLDGYIAKALATPKSPVENSYKKIKLPTK